MVAAATRVAFISVILIGVVPLRGGVIVGQHSGAADPASEGWTQLAVGTSVATGPVVGDSGGFDAWSVNDTSTTDSRAYRHALSFADTQQALSQGFIERARLRVVGAPTTTNGSVALTVLTSLLGFDIKIGCEADGDPILKLQNDSGTTSLTAQGAGGGYHLFELTYNPATQLADLRLDSQHLADYAGYHPVFVTIVANPSFVAFGSQSTNSVGAANYNLAQLELVPEPATLSLVVLAIPVATTLRRPARARPSSR
jgi:hypothetical protein